MNAERNNVKAFVARHEHPTTSDLYQTDVPSFAMSCYLLGCLSGLSITASSSVSGCNFLAPSGTTVFQYDQNGVPSGDYANKLDEFLLAIRIHEVDSYEWVNLDIHIREDLIRHAATRVGTTPEEIKKLSGLWVSYGA
jgi:hypothetical protein